jgi:hypothetical protein
MNTDTKKTNSTNSDVLTVDSLSFTSRDELGHIDWFDVEHPDKNSLYDWGKEFKRGKKLAKELLSFKNNPNAEINGNQLGFIFAAIVHKESVLPDGLYEGFFEAIGSALYWQ